MLRYRFKFLFNWKWKKNPMFQYVLYSKSMCVWYNSVCVSVLFSCKFVPEQKFKKGIIRKKINTNKKKPYKPTKINNKTPQKTKNRLISNKGKEKIELDNSWCIIFKIVLDYFLIPGIVFCVSSNLYREKGIHSTIPRFQASNKI